MVENINILNELKELNAGALIESGNKNIFNAPDDYFTHLPNNIITQIWLNSVHRINPYYLPANYFKNLPELILDKLVIKNYQSSNKQTYQVPDGYFNNLASHIIDKIKAANNNNNIQQELDELAPLLSKLPKTNIYTVPAGYFENLIPQTVPEVRPAKVISFSNKARKWFTYAAVACIAALMLGGGYFYLNGNKTSTGKTAIDISQYKDIKVDQAISQLSDDEINSYLKEDNSDISIPSQDDSQDVNIKTLIDNMSDEEINNYLRENSDPEENMRGS